jgi:HEAT repeat protein
LKDKKDASGGRWAATIALLRIGIEAKELVPLVLSMAADAEDEDREHALWALPAIGADPAAAVPVLKKALQDEHAQYARMLAAQALAKYGSKAKEALPALLQALADPDPQVRVDAAAAVWKVEQQAHKALPILVEALRGGKGTGMAASQNRAIHYLRQMGPEAKEAFPALLALWKDAAPQGRESLATALQAIDPQAAATAGVK